MTLVHFSNMFLCAIMGIQLLNRPTHVKALINVIVFSSNTNGSGRYGYS